MELLKLLSANELLAQVISFLVLFFVLRALAWKKVLGLLDARRDRIAAEFQKAQDASEGMAKLKIEYENRLAVIDATAQGKLQEAVEKGRAITDEVRKKAHEEAQDIISNARTHIAYELNKARDELKEQIVDLAIRATEQVVSERLTEVGDRKIVDDFLGKMKDARG